MPGLDSHDCRRIKSTFYSTWSPENFLGEGVAPCPHRSRTPMSNRSAVSIFTATFLHSSRVQKISFLSFNIQVLFSKVFQFKNIIGFNHTGENYELVPVLAHE